jgi:hypothetical protein
MGGGAAVLLAMMKKMMMMMMAGCIGTRRRDMVNTMMIIMALTIRSSTRIAGSRRVTRGIHIGLTTTGRVRDIAWMKTIRGGTGEMGVKRTRWRRRTFMRIGVTRENAGMDECDAL